MQSGIQNRLTACMLSPNITAYVTDAHPHVMVFSKSITVLVGCWNCNRTSSGSITMYSKSLWQCWKTWNLARNCQNWSATCFPQSAATWRPRFIKFHHCNANPLWDTLAQLTMSIVKQLSIMETTKSLANHCGIEVDSMHWNRFAFLVRPRSICWQRFHAM